jgi:competence protein ComEC
MIPKMAMPWTLLFYSLIISFLLAKSNIKKTWIVLSCVSIVVMFSFIERNESRLLFLDVGQGDSTILETKDCVAIIDSFSEVHGYLKHRGITQIDYLFLTHSDIDHIKEAEVILRDYHVDRVIGSVQVDSYPLYSKKMQKAKGGDQYSCGDLIFHVLAPIDAYEDENNASLVIKFNFRGKQVLLTGDIEYEAEMDLISMYGHKLKSDILKIAHHGSNTSSSSLFLFYVKPQLAIISAGRQNRYQFPHDEVLDRLISLDTTIYRTDQQGTIIFDPDRKGEKWYFHLPFSPRFWYNMYRVRGRMYG